VHLLSSLLGLLSLLVIVGGFVSLFVRRNRERVRNAPLRAEIEAQVRFQTRLQRARILGTGGFGGTRGFWISVRGPTRLTVGTDAFMISAPQALREYVFRGRETSIMVTQAPSRLDVRDWIVITGQIDGRQRQLAITQDNLPDIWEALEATGAAPELRVINPLSGTARPRRPGAPSESPPAQLGPRALRSWPYGPVRAR
jgi:hypothetical protein